MSAWAHAESLTVQAVLELKRSLEDRQATDNKIMQMLAAIVATSRSRMFGDLPFEVELHILNFLLLTKAPLPIDAFAKIEFWTVKYRWSTHLSWGLTRFTWSFQRRIRDDQGEEWLLQRLWEDMIVNADHVDNCSSGSVAITQAIAEARAVYNRLAYREIAVENMISTNSLQVLARARGVNS